MPTEVICTEAAHVNNAILLDCVTSKVELDKPAIGSTDPNIPMANTCTDDKLHFGMPGYSNNSEDEGDVIDESDAIPTTNQQQWATTELQRLVVGTGSINGYDGCDGHNADADDEEETLQANNGSTQNLEDCRHSTRD